MLNIIILYALTIILAASVILSIAELFCARNSSAGRFVRFFLIRLREHSMTRFFVISILALFWGLIVHDTCFDGIWTMILLLFALLIITHPENFFFIGKRRKKAKEKKRAPRLMQRSAEAALAKEASVLTELVPVSADDSQ